ncbi:Uu.00g010580.m01.CDS01 [Anthostomella pinea]|uniref:Dehydrogenase FUB6 n=1 Tax=Anthostomella pinea TaxID=933095 RepID=A0AAI8VXJ9_9PEZI|nr:Uu.00g010580.m01.CDS01 [Anthostomella pinea]
MVKSRQWLLAKKPTDMPQLDGPDATFKLTEKDLPEPKDGEIVVKAVYLSNDPAQRGWISPDINPERLYVPPVKEGTPMHARAISEVIESKSSSFKKGDWVFSSTGWSEYGVVPASSCQPAPELPGGMSRTHYLGALGGTGMTAWFGLTAVAQITKDDVVVISGAAGATGSMCVQIAKNIIGCKKVIGIAGTDEKCKWVESLGADTCLNYKKSSFADDLTKATPEFATVYFDNVGGEILDLMLTRMAKHGRVAACGAISNYNSSKERATGLKNWFEIISMRIQVRGFIVLDFMDKVPEAREVFTKALQEGKLKVEGSEHIVECGFEDVPKTWMHLFDGTNQGKLITKLQ